MCWVYLLRSEDNFWESVFSFHYIFPRAQTKVIRLVSRYLYLLILIHLTDSKIDVFEMSEMLLDYTFIILCLITVKMTHPGSSLFIYSENKYVHNSLLNPQ